MWKECWIFSKSGLGVILCSLYLPFIHTVPYHKFVSSVINSSLLILICIARLATQDTFARYRLKYNLCLWEFTSGGLFIPFYLLAWQVRATLGRFRSLFCLCDVFRVLINSLVYWFDTGYAFVVGCVVVVVFVVLLFLLLVFWFVYLFCCCLLLFFICLFVCFCCCCCFCFLFGGVGVLFCFA